MIARAGSVCLIIPVLKANRIPVTVVRSSRRIEEGNTFVKVMRDNASVAFRIGIVSDNSLLLNELQGVSECPRLELPRTR